MAIDPHRVDGEPLTPAPTVRRLGPALSLGLVLGLGLAQGACSGENKDSPPSEPPKIEISDANNYRSQSQLTIPSVETATGVDLDICWDGVENDLQCHPVDEDQPLVSVTLLRLLNVSHSQAEEKLASGNFDMADVNGYLKYDMEDGQSCMKLTDFTLRGSQVDIFEEYTESDELSYLLLFSDSPSPGVGTRTMMFLEPRDAATNTSVEAASGCGEDPMLDFEVDIAGADVVPVPESGPFIVEWRDLMQDSNGNPVPYPQIDRLLLAFYEGMSVADLEAQIFDIELVATKLWELDHDGGKDADLSLAVERDTGEPFAGFQTDEQGTWLLALLCSSCQNPAPILLTVLDPEGS